MKDIPIFDTDTGVSSLVLKEIPYRQVAYVRVRSVQPGGLEEHLRECVSFCRMCGAERVFAAGHAELEHYPVHCSVLKLGLEIRDRECCAELVPVSPETVRQWRDIYNEKMARVDNAATMEARDEKAILSSGGACFLRDKEKLLGIGWVEGNEIRCIASCEKGAGERILKTLLTRIAGERAELDVASTNARALQLYEKLGFVTESEVRKWYTIL